jgi:hypothetical protein
MVDNLEKELKMRSIFWLSDTILGVKWAIYTAFHYNVPNYGIGA